MKLRMLPMNGTGHRVLSNHLDIAHIILYKKKTSTLQDFQQTHSQAKLLMYAKYEIHHIVTQQTRSFQCKCPNNATRHLQL